MLSDVLEQELREAFARTVAGLDVDGVRERQLAMGYRPKPRHRTLVVLAAVVLVAVAVTLGLSLGTAGGPGQQLSLKLVADQVRLVGDESSAAVGAVVDIACSTAENCIAVGPAASGLGDVVAASADGGQSWTEQSLPPGVNSLISLGCVSESACVAAGRSTTGGPVIVATVDGGSQWSSVPVPSTVTALLAVSCSTAEDCWAVGASDRAAALVHGSVAGPWQLRDLPTASTATALTSVGCAPGVVPASCLAVGSDATGPVVVTTVNGSTWSTIPAPPGATSLTSANCPGGTSGNLCTVLARYGDYWTQMDKYIGGSTRWAGVITHDGDPAPGTIIHATIGNGPSSVCWNTEGQHLCAPQNADVARAVTDTIAGIASISPPTNEALLFTYLANSASADGVTTRPLSSVWYVGVAGDGLNAELVVSSEQRNGVVPSA